MAAAHHPKAIQPTRAVLPGNDPRALPIRQGHEQHPVFSLEHADRSCEEQFHFHPSPSESKRILELMCEMSCLSWKEVTRLQFNSTKRSRALHHEQPFDSLTRPAQARVSERKVDRLADELFRFRIGNLPRLWGFRGPHDDPTFYVLWWDPLHKVDATAES